MCCRINPTLNLVCCMCFSCGGAMGAAEQGFKVGFANAGMRPRSRRPIHGAPGVVVEFVGFMHARWPSSVDGGSPPLTGTLMLS